MMKAIFDKDILTPFIGRLASWVSWIPIEAHSDYRDEVEEYYLDPTLMVVNIQTI